VALASRFFAVGARNGFIRSGVGAVVTQAFFNPYRLRFIVRLLSGDGLYPILEEFKGLRSDERPVTPRGRSRRKYPNLDNQRIVEFKLRIRHVVAALAGAPTRLLHASDNTDEAVVEIMATLRQG